MTHRLGVIGGGNMGGAVVRGAIAAGVISPPEVVIADVDAPVREEFERIGCAVTAEPGAASGGEQVMLAVKPQVFDSVAASIGELAKPTVVISIMAGVTSPRIRSKLGEPARVVRVMPNTPCLVGKGMAGVAIGAGAQPGDEAFAMALFGAIGSAAVVDETLMDAVTAVSGSGPAYVFLLAESMQQAAEQMGMSHGEARLFVKQTIIGAGALLGADDTPAGELRQRVTSPGGTTAAALEVMFEAGLPQIVADALIAARDRGQELALDG